MSSVGFTELIEKVEKVMPIIKRSFITKYKLQKKKRLN